MENTLQRDRLAEVSDMAASLADKMLIESLSKGALNVGNGHTLRNATLLLKEHGHPVPDIVTGVLARFREADQADSEDGRRLRAGSAAGPNPVGRIVRFFRSRRASASA